jgi:hypothetical protein
VVFECVCDGIEPAAASAKRRSKGSEKINREHSEPWCSYLFVLVMHGLHLSVRSTSERVKSTTVVVNIPCCKQRGDKKLGEPIQALGLWVCESEGARERDQVIVRHIKVVIRVLSGGESVR